MDGEAWNLLVQAYAPPVGAFLQSYEWGEFQKSLGRTVVRIQEEKDGKVMIAQAITLPLPMGFTYSMVPKGPLGDMSPEQMSNLLRDRLKNSIFARIEPSQPFPKMSSVKDLHPSTTLTLDLAPGYDAVFGQFDAKARYNIRLGSRKGLTCGFYGLDRFDDFARLMRETASRDRFSLHPVEYYRHMLEFLAEGEVTAKLAFAMLDDVPIATIIVIDFAGTRVDLFGASGDTHRELKASHVLRNFVIKDACERGIKLYDFWGIAPEGAPESHPWHGLTYFKKSFGGTVVQSPGTYEAAYNVPVYLGYRAMKGLRSLK